jgi:Domain of unknown function (DUF4345)
MSPADERRCLQAAILAAGIVPVSGGLFGIFSGPWLLDLSSGCAASCDSHVRYLSGVLLGIGLIAWTVVPKVETSGRTFQLLTVLVVIGGFARLTSLAAVGMPSHLMVGGLLMELVITPLLCLWQTRLARRTRFNGQNLN